MKLSKYISLSTVKIIIYDLMIFINSMLESMYVNNESVTAILKLLRYGALLALFGSFLLTKKQKENSFVLAIVFFILCIMNYVFKGGSISLTATVCIFLACNKLPQEKIAKHTIGAVIFSYGFVIISSLLGIIPNLKLERWLSIGLWQGRYERQALGFQFPNQIPLMYFYIVAIYIFAHKSNLKLFHMAFIMIVDVLIYVFCNARTPLILVTFMLLGCIIINKKKSKIVCSIPMYLTIMLPFSSFIFSMGYLAFGGFSQKLDNVLNSRLSSAYITIKYWGVTLLGSGVEAGTKETGLTNTFSRNFLINVDNGYLIFLLQYGLLLTLLLIAVLFYFSLKIYIRQDAYKALALSIVLLSNVIDANFDSFRMWAFVLIAFNFCCGEYSYGFLEKFIKSKSKKTKKIKKVSL